MWTGGKAPPPPPMSPPRLVESPNRYRSERQNSELDQLRKRGLAKLLNKHFTTVTQTLAEERAAADAALQELESRKAAAGVKEWKSSSKSGEQLSVWDKMYMELQQKKADCKRKEKETLLLYQRYVDRFGNTGVVAVPCPKSTTVVPDASSLSPSNKRVGGGNVPLLAGQIESNLAKSSVKAPLAAESSTKNVANMDPQERVAYLRSLDGKNGGDSSENPLSDDDSPQKSFVTATTTSTEVTPAGKQDPPGDEVYRELDEDIRSIVSELTSAELSDAERVLLEFLKTETEAIRKLLDKNGGGEETSVSNMTFFTTNSDEIHHQSAKAADDAEDLVVKMQQMLQDFQSEAEQAAATANDNDNHEPRKLETSNPNEEWLVYWDESKQREYYFEVHSKTAQWSKPGSSPVKHGNVEQDDESVRVMDYTRSDRSSVPLSHYEVMPDMDGVTRTSRRDMYRSMLRRRRRRRFLLLVFLMTASIGAILYANFYHHEETRSTLVKALGSEELADNVIDTVENHLPDVVTGRFARNKKKQREERAKRAKAEADRKAKEEKERARREKEERQAAEAAERAIVIVNDTKPAATWACSIPHFFLVNSKRGRC